jgi:hypothetical protein
LCDTLAVLFLDDEMVLIVNGEIVPDNDPRAVARRGKSNSPLVTPTRGVRDVAGVQTLHDPPRAAGGRGPGQQHPPADYDEDGPLASVAQLLGISGRKVKVPAIPQINMNSGLAMPLINVVAACGAGALFGWRIGLALLLLVAAQAANNERR